MSQTTHQTELIGRKYTLGILRELSENGQQRYGRIKKAIGVRSDSTLSDRLDQLEEAGLIEREQFREIPPRVEYSITADGEACKDHIEALHELIE